MTATAPVRPAPFVGLQGSSSSGTLRDTRAHARPRSKSSQQAHDGSMMYSIRPATIYDAARSMPQNYSSLAPHEMCNRILVHAQLGDPRRLFIIQHSDST